MMKGVGTSTTNFLAINSKKNQPKLLSVTELFKIKRLALRQGLWHKALSRMERGILDLTIKCVNTIRSPKLAEALTAIVEKLSQTTESTVDRLVRSLGIPLAQKISSLAISWGNLSAKHWASDRSFARFLAIIQRDP